MIKHFHHSAMAAMVAAAALLLSGCAVSSDKYGEPDLPGDSYWTADGGSCSEAGGSEGGEGAEGESGDSGNSSGEARRLTAGEWRDLDHWSFWGNLLSEEDYSGMPTYWGYDTDGRVAVRLTTSEGKAVCGERVELLDAEGVSLYAGVTDVKGEVNLFPRLFSAAAADSSSLQVRFAGTIQPVSPTLYTDSAVVWNTFTAVSPNKQGADILFIVDATGSMGDEIDFLKEDLQDIIDKAQVHDLRTAALFYRDEGDDYITRVSDFTASTAATIHFMKDQYAEGGGDYPEAVHSALSAALQDLNWRTDSRVKLAFMLLDAPPHYETQIVESIHQSNLRFAEQGIRIIPIGASGIDKSTEFLLRYLAITTGGTYTFLTDDSGIGDSHITPSVGDYQVEILNDLLLRLIKQYTAL